MTTRLIALLLLCFAPPLLASELDEAISQRITHSETMRGEFTQLKQLALLPQPLKSNGRFLYHQQHGLLWHTQSPLESQVLFRHDGIHNLSQPQQSPSGAAAEQAMRLFSQLFFALIQADMAQLAKYFEIDGENTAEQWSLQLTPKSGDIRKIIKNLQLKGDEYLQQVEFTDSNNDLTTIHFHHQQTTPLSREELQRLVP